MNQPILSRTVIVLVVFALAFGGCQNPKGKIKLADKYFSEFEFLKSAEIFEDVLKKDPQNVYALRQASEARTLLGDYDMAAEHLKVLSQQSEAKPEDLIKYAEVLKMNQRYEEAINVYAEYVVNNPTDEVVKNYVSDSQWLEKIMRDSSSYSLVNSPINTSGSDFGLTFVDDGFLFSSSRAEGKGKRKIYAWNDQSYLNLYHAEVGVDSALANPRVLKNKANTRFHEGTATYDSTNHRLYFTRNYFSKGKQKKSSEGNLNLAIFEADFAGGEVGTQREFSFNNPEYSVGHPTLSSDGNTMYFVSDNPRGVGGSDLYVVHRESTGWSKPELLSSQINTTGNEMFPFLMNDSILYFSSDRLPGLGGLDVFEANLAANPVEVRNLGYPINTPYDDFGLIMYNHQMSGYFSSNRPGGQGDDDIYRFSISRPSTVIISGRVVDVESLEPLPNAIVYVTNEDGSMLEVARTDENGNYSFETDHQRVVPVRAEKEGYMPTRLGIVTNEYSKYVDNVEVALMQYDHMVEGVVRDAENGNPVEDATLTLIDESERIQDKTITGEDGKYQFGLQDDQTYTVELTKFGYPDQEIVVDTRELEDSTITSDFRLFELKEGAVVRLDNIYYDYNKSDIRADAGRELDKLVKIMKDNPTMKIELSSHTDSRGDGWYNQKLSQARAKAAKDYLVAHGIASSRVVGKGYGEKKIMNKCKEGVECSEEEHQLNRRTEFKILDV
ncbi:MAG: carboxypeptidase regulatory-like domain-containing protein [Flavobacteriales bacterium]|nr:carboxypeptidase regulatory-like domain-containing protein [Flavobacteriales bacterium]